MNQPLKKTDGVVFGKSQAEFVFYAAADFFERGLAAAKEFEKDSRSEKIDFWRISFPICNLSFSLELVLKLLINFSENYVKPPDHNLYELYKQVPDELREAIENHFETCGAHNYRFLNLKIDSGKGKVRDSKTGSTKIKIEDALQQSRKAYIQFRYLYEKMNENYYFDFNTIIKLIHSCLAVSKNKLQTLELLSPCT